MRIHKEGIKIIPIAAVVIGLLYWGLYLLIPVLVIQYLLGVASLIFFVLIVRFFRNPRVETLEKEGAVYAPAEGKVVVIEKVFENEFLQKDCIQVSIFMSPLNVHVNRSPVKGKINFYQYHPGKFFVAWHPKSSTHNERTSIGIKIEEGVEILMRQIAGAVARRIAFYPKVGDTVQQGSSVGFIRFGSRVDLFLPLDAEILVKIGDLTKGGETVVAKLALTTSY